MKLVINFDFLNAIRDNNEKFIGFKIIRNNRKRWCKVNLPLCLALDAGLYYNNLIRVIPVLMFQAFLTCMDY